MSTRTYTNPELIDTLDVGLSAPLFEGTVW